jgi:alpha-galactosidase
MNRLIILLTIFLMHSGCQQNSRTLNDMTSNPVSVQAFTEQESVYLTKYENGIWKANNIEVYIEGTDDGASVYVTAPNVKLRKVKIEWNIKTNPEAKILGDAWERSYGDLGWKTLNANDINPWYAMVSNANITNGFGVKTGTNTMCFWKLSQEKVSLTLDTKSGGLGVNLGERKLHAADLVFREGKEGESSYQATREFCKLMCPVNNYLPKERYVGWLDWYISYGDYNANDFINETKAFAELVNDSPIKAFSLVDAGWAIRDSKPSSTCWHDYQDRGSDRFPDMKLVATEIKSTGLIPGIWTRPLCTNPNDTKIRLQHDSTLIDPSVPENLEYVKNMMNNFREWGYDIIKHDFSQVDIFGRWGKEMGAELTDDGWTFQDSTKTTAEIILNLYKAIREGAGDDCTIIGCNTISHLSAGIFEFYRVGDDSGNNLERALKYGPNGLIYRLPQDGIFYSIDPDCIGNLTNIPWWYNKQFMDLISKSYGLLYFSTEMDKLTIEHKTAIKRAIEEINNTKEHTLEPIDWIENSLPQQWKDAKDTYQLNWEIDNH